VTPSYKPWSNCCFELHEHTRRKIKSTDVDNADDDDVDADAADDVDVDADDEAEASNEDGDNVEGEDVAGVADASDEEVGT
jgi:hypothetical protein